MFWLSIVFVCLAAIAKSITDTVSTQFDTSKFKKLNRNWWNALVSYTNKYKNGIKADGPKFFLSTTLFVWLTDAKHFFTSIMVLCFTFAIISYKVKYGILLDFTILTSIRMGVFYLFYEKLWK